jgi:hypothetical protein
MNRGKYKTEDGGGEDSIGCKQISKTYILILASSKAIYGVRRMKKRMQVICFQR